MKKQLHIRIFGLVQGVWFRKSAREKALGLGIEGFVRNEMDGSVYIEAEGEKEALDQFVEWCAEGPELARVERTDISEGAFVGRRGFVIQH